MTRRDAILIAMAAADGASYSPVQIQKLMFLLDKKAAAILGGPHFHFKPYDYGPFDSAVYAELNRLSENGLVTIDEVPDRRSRMYRLSSSGLAEGKQLLSKLSSPFSQYVADLSRWVRSLRFDQLVSAIYTEFPEMKANSIFQGAST